MYDLVRFDAELVKTLRKERGWTQERLAAETGSVGLAWIRKVEAGKPVRLEWNGKNGAVNAGEDLAMALKVELNALILDSLDGGKIKRLRTQRNQGLERFAEHAHVSVELVKAAEAGGVVHRADTRSLADALGVSPFELLLQEESTSLNLDAEDSSLNMHAGMLLLGLLIQSRAKLLGKPVPVNEEVRKEAHGRLMFAIWKLGKDVGTESSPRRSNSPYALAIETAVGSELASRIRRDPDCLPVIHAKRIAYDLDEEMISALSRCEAMTRAILNEWIRQYGRKFDWDAPEADLVSLCMAGSSAMAQTIYSNAPGKSTKLLKACASEGNARIDFLCILVSRHYRYFSRLSANDHSEFIRLVMLFVAGSYNAGTERRPLRFLEAVGIEQKTQDDIAEARARVTGHFPPPDKPRQVPTPR